MVNPILRSFKNQMYSCIPLHFSYCLKIVDVVFDNKSSARSFLTIIIINSYLQNSSLIIYIPMKQTISNQALAKLSTIEDVKGQLTIEQVLKSKYGVYLQHKHLIEHLFTIEQDQILEPYTYLWNLGGKKVRVIAALLIHDLFDHKFKEEAIKVGGLIEHLHCASLIIDDIEDGSVKRRGKPCSHTIYGIDYAINAANLMYFLPIHKLISSFPTPQLKWRINEIYLNQMTLCHIGQGLDIKYHNARSKAQLPSTEDYIKLTSLKTGGLLRMLVKMMGAVMGIGQEPLEKLTECMTNVGVAFQIIDDILNVANSEESMGKGVVAEDLHQGKFTLIVDFLRDNEEFLQLFFIKEKSEAVILRLLQIINESGVLEKCKVKAKEYADKALDLFQQLQCTGDKKPFQLFIKFIIERKN